MVLNIVTVFTGNISFNVCKLGTTQLKTKDTKLQILIIIINFDFCLGLIVSWFYVHAGNVSSTSQYKTTM